MIEEKFIKRDGKVLGLESLLSRLGYRLGHLMNGDYVLSVKKRTQRRTIPQNALYWEWMTIIGQEIGYSKTECHEAFKQKFLKQDFKEVLGEMVMDEPTTRQMKTREFSAYMDQVSAFASSELGITLPSPEDLVINQ